MCAGRCHEPRCIRSPCRGSQRLHRALGGTRILLAAAPTAPPCFCRWQRSSLLHRGFFPRRTIRRVDAVRIHPCSPFSRQIKQKLRYPLDTGVLGGRGWIRTTEAESSRFTVCPHWPLGNTPIFTFCVLRRTTCLFYHAERLLSTVFLPFSSNAFSVQSKGGKSPAAMQARQSRRKKPAGRN